MASKIRKHPVDWEDIYRDNQNGVWEAQPHTYTKKAAQIATPGKAIDLGCGEGHDVLYLAQQGFDVTGVDTSENALSSMNNRASQLGLSISTIRSDVNDLTMNESYNVIVSYGVLHFLGSGSYLRRINSFQETTNQGGVHAMYVFSNDGDFYDIAKHRFWFPPKDELLSLYRGWNVLEIESKRVELLVKGDNGQTLYNTMLKLLASKDRNG